MNKLLLILIMFATQHLMLRAEEVLRTDKEEIEIPGGKAVIEDTYRGDVRILRRMVVNGAETITFFRDGKPVLIEGDDNHDGFREKIIIPGDTMDDFEEFTRLKNGQIVPTPTKQKGEKAKIIRERTAILIDAISEASKEFEKKLPTKD
ncbi:MAG: hypothetical protein PF495_10115 [Spirochaetales bacterium]|jgi:hypothetical protein|nr:hypothetical protein [Spirochaetales bacterium]